MLAGRLATELAVFYRCLSVLLNSGVHILKALDVAASQCEIPSLAATLLACRAEVASGRRLSEAMGRYPSYFHPMDVRLVAVGENTGGLHKVLERLADHAEKSVALRRKVSSALTYPCFVLGASLVMLLVAPALVFRNLLALLSQLSVSLPWSTRVLLFVARLLQSPWFYLFLVMAAGLCGWGLWEAAKRPEWHARGERLLLALPGIGEVVRAAFTAQFCRALALGYAAGVPILRAVKLCGSAGTSRLVDDMVERTCEHLMDGHPISAALEDSGLFEPMVLSILAAGEEAGKVSDSLAQAAQLCEEQVELSLARATTLLQPVFLLAIGVAVGFMVIATMAPLMKVLQSL